MSEILNNDVMDERIEPGLVRIDTCLFISPRKNSSIDVTALVVDLTLYEDIMTPFITGCVTILDASALTEELPLIGEEMMYLEISTPGFQGPEYVRSGMYTIYKMESRENIANKSVAYKLMVSSIESLTDMNQRISKTYRGKISDTITTLINSHPGLSSNKTAVVEPTVNSEMHTSNFWTPTQNIYYLTSKALNDINNPNYVFFENNEGFVFASIDSLYLAPVTYSFTKDSKMRGNSQSDNPDAGQNLNEEYGKILDMSIPSQYDYIDRVLQGYYGSSVYHYDLITKRLNFKNIVAFDDLTKVKLNEEPLASQHLQFMPEASMSLTIIHRDLYNGSPNLPATHHIRRLAFLKQTTGMQVMIRVFGKMNYSVGNVVDLMVYKDDSTDKKNTQVIDEVLTGRYLITSLSHEITRANHFCNIELSKDSMNKTINSNVA